MKVAPYLQMDAVLWYLSTCLKTEPNLINLTESGNPEDVVRKVASWYPIRTIGDTMEVYGRLPILALVPSRASYVTDALNIVNTVSLNLMYVMDVPKGEDIFSGGEKTLRMLSHMWWYLVKACEVGVIGTYKDPKFSLRTDAYIQALTISNGRFSIERSSYGVLQADVSMTHIHPPFEDLPMAKFSSIYLELLSELEEQGITFEGITLLDE